MAFVKIIDGIVVQKQPTQADGFIEADDSVVCGMLYDSEGFSMPSPSQVNYTTLSKLKAIDYFIDTNQFDAFMAFIEADKKREQRWNAAQNLDIDDPMMDDYCSEFNVSEQELQGLFNALNTQQA